MTFYKYIFYILLIYFLNINLVSSNEKISYLDMEYVIKNSIMGKSVLENINKLNKKNIDILKKKEDELKALEDSIKKKKILFLKRN